MEATLDPQTRSGDPYLAAGEKYRVEIKTVRVSKPPPKPHIIEIKPRRPTDCPHCYGSGLVMMGREDEHGEYTEIGVPCRRCGYEKYTRIVKKDCV